MRSHEKVVARGRAHRGAGPRRRPHRRDHPRGGGRAGGGLEFRAGNGHVRADDADHQTIEDIAEHARRRVRARRRRAATGARYNVAPSDTHWILEYGAAPAGARRRRVGLCADVAARRARKPLINVRGEQVASGHGFREAFASRRCAVVIDGFFEWNSAARAVLVPPRRRRADPARGPLSATCPRASTSQRFTVLTTRPEQADLRRSTIACRSSCPRRASTTG